MTAATIAIDTADELMRLALDPNVSLYATTQMLRECAAALSARSAALNACRDPKQIAREFHEIQGIAQRLAKAQTDAATAAARAQARLGDIANAHTTREAMLAIYQALATDEQRAAVSAAFAA